jgi:hypothetical protein
VGAADGSVEHFNVKYAAPGIQMRRSEAVVIANLLSASVRLILGVSTNPQVATAPLPTPRSQHARLLHVSAAPRSGRVLPVVRWCQPPDRHERRRRAVACRDRLRPGMLRGHA